MKKIWRQGLLLDWMLLIGEGPCAAPSDSWNVIKGNQRWMNVAPLMQVSIIEGYVVTSPRP